MNYFIDTEFHEYHKQPKVCGIKIGKPIPTIDLISIGIVSENVIEKISPHIDSCTKEQSNIHEAEVTREYYAISKDFNIKDAWYSYQREPQTMFEKQNDFKGRKVYWLRENVLKPIWMELFLEDEKMLVPADEMFTYQDFKYLINKYGKTNKQIAEEIKEFVFAGAGQKVKFDNSINFYAYYADYDWVVFAQLFGKMIDLPKGFPMYCKDLKQELDNKAESLTSAELSKLAYTDKVKHNVYGSYDTGVLKCTKSDLLKHALTYPKQENEHNALDDAKWDKKLHEFINIL